MELLSKYLTYEAAVASTTATKYGIKNIPTPRELVNLKAWGTNIYDPIVDQFGLVYLSSVFRCKLLNSHPTIGGSKVSGHVAQNGQPRWIHIGFRKYNRKQALIALKNSKGETYYTTYSKALFDKLYRSNKKSLGKTTFDNIVMTQDELNTFRAEGAELIEEVSNNKKLILPSLVAKEHNSLIIEDFASLK